MEESRTDSEQKQVVIIGTGPSAIALSYFLSGHVPYWNGCPVSNDILNVKLEEFVKDRSLFDQDFEFLSEGLEGHSPSPIGLFFDYLMHPDADLGADLQSKLKWRDEPAMSIEHVCLGLTGIGGRWHRLRSEHFQTVTMANRMELPNYSFSLFRQQRRVDRTRNSQRATYDEVRAYFIHYVKRFGLKNFFRTGCRVTSIDRVASNWQIRGFDENQQKQFFITAKFLVLATGISESITRPLSCLGEETIHSLTYTNPLHIENLIIRQKKLNETSQPLLIVGFGPTAIDVILLCDRYSIPILHVFRRSIDDPELILNRYSSCIYPEYDRVRDLIRNSPTSFYRCFPQTEIFSFGEKQGLVYLRHLRTNQFSEHEFSFFARLTGNNNRSNFLPNFLNMTEQRFSVDPLTYQCAQIDSLYAIGALVGEKSVRFCQASAFACAVSLLKTHRTQH